jgi:hypothetical protein
MLLKPLCLKGELVVVIYIQEKIIGDQPPVGIMKGLLKIYPNL